MLPLAVPNEVPVIVEIRNSSSTSLYVRWTPVNDTNGAPLLGYIVFYKPMAGATFVEESLASVGRNETETELEDLDKYSNYSLRVLAFTENGNGVSSERSIVTTDEDGELVQDHGELCG